MQPISYAVPTPTRQLVSLHSTSTGIIQLLKSTKEMDLSMKSKKTEVWNSIVQVWHHLYVFEKFDKENVALLRAKDILFSPDCPMSMDVKAFIEIVRVIESAAINLVDNKNCKRPEGKLMTAVTYLQKLLLRVKVAMLLSPSYESAGVEDKEKLFNLFKIICSCLGSVIWQSEIVAAKSNKTAGVEFVQFMLQVFGQEGIHWIMRALMNSIVPLLGEADTVGTFGFYVFRETFYLIDILSSLPENEDLLEHNIEFKESFLKVSAALVKADATFLEKYKHLIRYGIMPILEQKVPSQSTEIDEMDVDVVNVGNVAPDESDLEIIGESIVEPNSEVSDDRDFAEPESDENDVPEQLLLLQEKLGHKRRFKLRVNSYR